MVALAVLACKYIITPVAQHLFEQYVYDGTTPVPSSIEPDRLTFYMGLCFLVGRSLVLSDTAA